MTDATTPAQARQHETLDALAWRHLGDTAGHVEATLAANPGLARIAADLPAGHPVQLVHAPAPTRKLIQLWE